MWGVSLRNCQVMLTELVLGGGYRAGDLGDCDPPPIMASVTNPRAGLETPNPVCRTAEYPHRLGCGAVPRLGRRGPEAWPTAGAPFGHPPIMRNSVTCSF